MMTSLLKRLCLVLAALVLSPLTSSEQLKCCLPSTPPGGLPNTFFGMTQTQTGGAHNPTVNFFVSRMWDTNCTWNFTNTANGTENFSGCDAKMDQAQSVGASVSFVMGRTPLWAIQDGVGSVAVSNGGSGYGSPPTVSFSGGGGGTGAAATAVLTSGVVTSVVITNTGTGYTSAPAVSFSSGAATATSALQTCTGSYQPNGCAQAPSDLRGTDSRLKTFITDLVNHVKARYPSMHWYLECVNEADLFGEWNPATSNTRMADLVTYCTDMKTTAQAIDPTIFVLGPAASTYNQFGVHLYGGAGGYMTISGAALSFDAMNIHPYFSCAPDWCQNPETAIAANSQVQSLLNSSSIPTKPVIMSESDWGNQTANANMTDTQRGGWIGRFAMYTYNSGWKGFWFYQWDCASGTLSACFGTMSGSGVGTVVATYFGTIQTWLIGSTHSANSCNQNVDGHSTWSCNITSSTGAAQTILFNASGNQTVTVSSAYTAQDFLDGTNAAIVSHQVTVGVLPTRVR